MLTPTAVALCAAVALATALTSEAVAQDGTVPSTQPARQERVVRWINDAPEGPGLEHKVHDSAAMGHEIGYTVYTPPAYEAEPERRFPVLYFLHGAGGSESQDAPDFSRRVGEAIDAGTLPPMLVVFPNAGMSGYRDPVETFLVEELVPMIDRDYRTIGTRESRVAAGFSMGGSGGTYLAMRHPDLFAATASWGGGGRGGDDRYLEALESTGEALAANDFAILAINGDEDGPQAFEQLFAKLESIGVDHEKVVLDDQKHNLGRYYERTADQVFAFLAEHVDASE